MLLIQCCSTCFSKKERFLQRIFSIRFLLRWIKHHPAAFHCDLPGTTTLISDSDFCFIISSISIIIIISIVSVLRSSSSCWSSTTLQKHRKTWNSKAAKSLVEGSRIQLKTVVWIWISSKKIYANSTPAAWIVEPERSEDHPEAAKSPSQAYENDTVP